MPLIGFITCANSGEAKKIANALLEKRLVACANIIREIDSSYWWKGRIEKANESLLIIKTKEGLAEKIIEEAKKIHSYELPAIEFIKTEKYGKSFADWIESSVQD